LVIDHDDEPGSTPSHCSTATRSPSPKPVAMIVNDCGFPAASPGTWNGDADGVVIVPANATPAVAIDAINTMVKTSLRRAVELGRRATKTGALLILEFTIPPTTRSVGRMQRQAYGPAESIGKTRR
jgi:hypothetical protein